VWSSTAELAQTWRLDRRFEPTTSEYDEGGGRDGAYRRWRAAVERAKGWAVE
jgi:glycerol kinase